MTGAANRHGESSAQVDGASVGELTDRVTASLIAAFASARPLEDPFRHWIVSDVFPAGVVTALDALPMEAAGVGGISGKRELHNDTRRYFDAATNAGFPACAAVAAAFQSREVAKAIEVATGARLAGSFVRLEYAQDVNGFWLEPHTDLGVKTFTMLIYLRPAEGQETLGTDLYKGPGDWAKRIPFTANSAVVFVPAGSTWHGMERREISGVRKSVIMNYVTDDWRAREQLAYPTTPVRA